MGKSKGASANVNGHIYMLIRGVITVMIASVYTQARESSFYRVDCPLLGL